MWGKEIRFQVPPKTFGLDGRITQQTKQWAPNRQTGNWKSSLYMVHDMAGSKLLISFTIAYIIELGGLLRPTSWNASEHRCCYYTVLLFSQKYNNIVSYRPFYTKLANVPVRLTFEAHDIHVPSMNNFIYCMAIVRLCG